MSSTFSIAKRASGMLGALVLLSACAELGEPDLGAAPGENAAPIVAVAEAPAAIEGEPLDATALPVFMPERPIGYVPELIVSWPLGVVVLDADLVEPLTFSDPDLISRRAVDDFFGGVVIEKTDGQSLWFSEEADDGVVINEGAGQLLDVGFIENPEALFAPQPQEITRYDLVSGEVKPFATFDDNESVLAATFGGGLYVVALANDACGALAFLNTAGARVELVGPEVDDCPVAKQPSFTHVAMTPSGDFYAYTQVGYRSDGVAELTEAVVTETATGASVRIAIAGVSESVTSLSFDGTRIGFVRETERPNEVVVIDIARPDSPLVVEIDGATSVAFARIPLRVGGANE